LEFRARRRPAAGAGPAASGRDAPGTFRIANRSELGSKAGSIVAITVSRLAPAAEPPAREHSSPSPASAASTIASCSATDAARCASTSAGRPIADCRANRSACSPGSATCARSREPARAIRPQVDLAVRLACTREIASPRPRREPCVCLTKRTQIFGQQRHAQTQQRTALSRPPTPR